MASFAGAKPPDEDELDMVWIAQQLEHVMAVEEAAVAESPRAMVEAAEPPTESFSTTRDVGEYAQDVDARFVPPQGYDDEEENE